MAMWVGLERWVEVCSAAMSLPLGTGARVANGVECQDSVTWRCGVGVNAWPSSMDGLVCKGVRR